jgi:polysaccharide export outer membrane protein
VHIYLKGHLLNRKANILLLVCCLLVADLPLGEVFAQVPREFTRLRSTYQGVPLTPQTLSPTGERVPEYYLAANDKLDIFVWQNPDLSRAVSIRPDGKLSYPLVGTMDVAGLTIDQLQNAIQEKLAVYIRFPQVVVSLVESAGNKVVVLGQVNYPGIFTFKGNVISLIEVIAMAGDFTVDSRRESVMVISDNFSKNPKVRKIDLLTAIRNGVSNADILIKPDDVVYVPRSTVADVSKFFNDIQPVISGLSNIMGLGGTFVTNAAQLKGFFWHRTVKIVNGAD